MQIIKDINIMVLDCTYQEKHVAQYLGFKWDSTVKCWYSTTKRLIKEIGDYTPQDLEAIKKHLQNNIVSSHATDSKLDIPKPEGLEYLPFQKAGIEFAIKNPQMLNSSEMGLGKTIQAIGVANYKRFRNILIVTTASVKLNWKKELEKWLTYPINIEVLDASKPFTYKEGILILNYDILKKFESHLYSVKFDCIIADEVHYVKNKKALRSHIFYKIVKSIKHKIYLSGTPIADRPLELYDIIKSLGFKENKSTFTNRYCITKHNGFGFQVIGTQNLDQLQETLRSQFMYRVMKKDVLKELPDKFKQIIYIEDPKSLKLQQQAVQKYLLDENLTSEEYNSFIEKSVGNFDPKFIGVIAQMRKESAINKLPFTINLIKEVLESKDKVVIFAHHKDVVSALYDEFKDISVKLDGGTSMEGRQISVDRFQNDPSVKLFIGSILAAGTGITLTASNHVIFVEMDWTPSNMMQAEDRCHRVGTKSNVTIQYIVVDGSIDAMVAKKLVKKENVFNEIFN